MSCNDNQHHFPSNCVIDVVRFIDELQDSISENCPTGCDTPFLGANCNSPFANTRPFVLFDKCGDLFIPASCFSIPTKEVPLSVPLPSPFLRVESVDEDGCAVLRVLIPDVESLGGDDCDLLAGSLLHTIDKSDFTNLAARFLICQYSNGITKPDYQSVLQFGLKASQFCITVDLSCFCAIQCLRDTHVRGC